MKEYMYRIMQKLASDVWVPVSQPSYATRAAADLKVWKASGYEVKLQRQEIMPWEDVEGEVSW